MSLKVLNPNAEVLNKSHALHMTINAAKGLHDVLKSPELIGGAGDIKLTKDRNTLSKEMQIQSPTAIMIARPAVAQDDTGGDGTTSTVIFIGELMKRSEQNVHRRSFLKSLVVMGDKPDKEMLKMVARTALRTKGAKAFEVAARQYMVSVEYVSRFPLMSWKLWSRAQLGVEAFCRCSSCGSEVSFAENSGLDTQDMIIELGREHDKRNVVGLNFDMGEPIYPQMVGGGGILDNYNVKLQLVNSRPVIASQLLLVDVIIHAGCNMRISPS